MPGLRIPQAVAGHGMVTSAHYLASQAGIWMLRRGGNAVDAAVCAATTMAVVAPHLNGAGGDLFAQVWEPATGVPVGLNASGRSGSQSTLQNMRSLGAVDEMPERGALTITVPGVISGWKALLDRFGTRRLFDVMEPAIDYAEHGSPVTAKLAHSLEENRNLILKHPSFRKVFTRSGELLPEGTAFVNADLASSLREIGRSDGESYYRGQLAARLVGGIRSAGGVLELNDFVDHHADWVEPMQTEFGHRTVYELPPNTQGATALELLNLTELLDLQRLERNSARYIHELTHCMSVAYEDRDEYITDPEFTTANVDRIATKEYAQQRIGNMTTTDGVLDHGDTINLCVVDARGLAVSLIQSHYMGFGSGVMAEGTGIHFHNRGTYFSLDPAHMNCLQPRKRTMHTLIPALALKDGALDMVFGSMGGDAQPQIQLQMLLNHFIFDLDLQAAVEAPRFIHAPAVGSPNRILLESRFPPECAQELRRLGHEVQTVDAWSSLMGHAHAIRVDAAAGLLRGAADPRGDGAAIGY